MASERTENQEPQELRENLAHQDGMDEQEQRETPELWDFREGQLLAPREPMDYQEPMELQELLERKAVMV